MLTRIRSACNKKNLARRDTLAFYYMNKCSSLQAFRFCSESNANISTFSVTKNIYILYPLVKSLTLNICLLNDRLLCIVTKFVRIRHVPTYHLYINIIMDKNANRYSSIEYAVD